MCKLTKLVRVDNATYRELKRNQVKTGVPIGKQVKFKVFGKATKVKVGLI
jgi:hypothetical protein